jgi:hypothetical protein
MLLAASLRFHLGFDIELVAAIPPFTEQEDTLRSDTLILIDELAIRTERIENRISKDYPIGNKVACLGIHTHAETIVFLDSDILCLKKLPPSILSGPVSLKPADLHTASRSIDDWKHIYSLFGLPLPKRRVVATVSGETMVPYFNAGVVAVSNGLELYSAWENCCRQINSDPSVTNKYPHLDQLALPVAIEQLNVNFHSLSEQMNYPAHLKLISDTLPVFCHYHWPTIIRREAVLNHLILVLAQKYAPLKNLIATASQDWQKLLNPSKLVDHYVTIKNRKINFGLSRVRQNQKHRRNPIYPDLLITGIPRSGTSLLCRLLHESPDTVIINEPVEIFEPLTYGGWPSWMASYYRELRIKILDGVEIENKVVDGQVTEDTREADQRVMYQPSVHRPDFVLGTKNTLAYLARLSLLRNAMPNAPIVACIRNPFYTIASWKTSFPHLQKVDFSAFPVAYTDNRFLTGIEKNRLAEIINCEEIPIKHALLWRHMAEIIRENNDRLSVVRYEDLIEKPGVEIKNIATELGDSRLLKTGKHTLVPRSKRDVLDQIDIHAINDICGEVMQFFGYDTQWRSALTD